MKELCMFEVELFSGVKFIIQLDREELEILCELINYKNIKEIEEL